MVAAVAATPRLGAHLNVDEASAIVNPPHNYQRNSQQQRHILVVVIIEHIGSKKAMVLNKRDA